MSDVQYTAQEIDNRLLEIRNSVMDRINKVVITNMTPAEDPLDSANSLLLNVIKGE